jgi:branched-subunit amino acid ABC-type transport system permease component
MQLLYGTWIAVQAGRAWTSAAIFLIALVICCLVMMFMMRTGMGGRSRSETEKDRQPNKYEGEQPGTKKP